MNEKAVTVDHIEDSHHIQDGAKFPRFEGLTLVQVLFELRNLIGNGDFGDMGGIKLSLTDGNFLEVENHPAHLMGVQQLRLIDHKHNVLFRYM